MVGIGRNKYNGRNWGWGMSIGIDENVNQFGCLVNPLKEWVCISRSRAQTYRLSHSWPTGYHILDLRVVTFLTYGLSHSWTVFASREELFMWRLVFQPCTEVASQQEVCYSIAPLPPPPNHRKQRSVEVCHPGYGTWHMRKGILGHVIKNNNTNSNYTGGDNQRRANKR